jgi:tetratricopeptide (TPR) repeat protein
VAAREFAKARTVLESAISQYERDQALRLALADLLVRLSRPQPDDDGNEPDPLSDTEQRAFTQAAYAQFLAALQIGPRTAPTEFAAGSLARDLGDTNSAIAHFQSAATLDTSNAVYPLHLAQVLFARDDLAAANAQLAFAVSLDPDEARAWGMMAEIALRQGSPRIALQHLERATALQPRLPAWRHMQARAFNRVSEPDEALKSLDTLTESDRYDRTALLLAGQACGLAGKPAEALARYEAALAVGTKDMRIYLDAASWAERVGEKNRAIELARMAAMAEVDGAQRTLDRLQPEH